MKGKNVVVIGLARSGAGAANLLSELGAKVTVTDMKREEELKDFIQGLNPAVRFSLGSHPAGIFLNADLVVISPGVPLDIRPVLDARARGLPIISELELAYQIVNSGQDRAQIPFLSVTGTNGKSTTTALLDFMMKKAGFRTILGGNIGNALTEEVYKQKIFGREHPVDFIVAEVSSFQLDTIVEFRPKVAAIVNITPDHLDRYHSSDEYSGAKARMFENQTKDDSLVLNFDDAGTMKVFRDPLRVRSSEFPKTFFFSRKGEVNGIYSKNGVVYCNFKDSELMTQNSELIKADEIKIKGVHNLENAMAASAMALLAGCPVGAVIESLKEFRGLEHRLEFVRELNGVSYFNDSKGTNVGAVMKSLESFSSPVILIAGGRDKAGDFFILKGLVKERVKSIVLIGEASQKIRKALGDISDTVMAVDLRDAVNKARSIALKGDIVLLSPACASFDMFLNFEDRGKQFKKIVMEMEQ